MARRKSKGKKPTDRPSSKSNQKKPEQTSLQSPTSPAELEPAEIRKTDRDEAVTESFPESPSPQAETLAKGGGIEDIEGSDPRESDFAPLVLEKTVIAMPLFKQFQDRVAEKEKKEKETGKREPEPVYPIIIDVNLLYSAGREKAKSRVRELIHDIFADNTFERKATDQQGVNAIKTRYSQQYVFAVLEENIIKELVRRDYQKSDSFGKNQAIYHIWPDFEVKKLTTKSVSTVKADAARNAFSAYGEDIIWAVMDSGIDEHHPHFIEHKNLQLFDLPDALQHRDFTVLSTDFNEKEDLSKEIDMTPRPEERPMVDEFGHGTHVAGIIAGEFRPTGTQTIMATTLHRDENKKLDRKEEKIKQVISGMAPKCKLVSLKVLDKDGKGSASNLIAAIEWIREINGNGRNIRIHGINMSVGYEFEPEWFACGQSPLCVEVDRLVKSGVVVVVAAGNTGYGWVQAQGKKTSVTAGLDLTINDPGNADLAITVGATHREKPHIYGVSYFSSKGPTGDGRLKPDLVAPGEKIISCYSAARRAKDPRANPGPQSEVKEVREQGETENSTTGYYREESGTSMAAPHVSGVIAAFLSIRREFIGRPEAVKEIFLSTATNLNRERYFQGHGLVDLMRAIQSV